MRKLLSFAALFALMQISFPGGIVRFSGAITPGHIATWSSSGVLQDGGAAPAGATILESLADQTVTGTTMTNATSFSFSAAANTNYRVDCYMVGQVVTGGTGQFQWTGPASPGNVIYSSIGAVSGVVATAFGTASAMFNSTASLQMAVQKLDLQNGANAGTVQLQINNNTGGDGNTLKRGSFCIVQ